MRLSCKGCGQHSKRGSWLYNSRIHIMRCPSCRAWVYAEDVKTLTLTKGVWLVTATMRASK